MLTESRASASRTKRPRFTEFMRRPRLDAARGWADCFASNYACRTWLPREYLHPTGTRFATTPRPASQIWPPCAGLSHICFAGECEWLDVATGFRGAFKRRRGPDPVCIRRGVEHVLIGNGAIASSQSCRHSSRRGTLACRDATRAPVRPYRDRDRCHLRYRRGHVPAVCSGRRQARSCRQALRGGKSSGR